jgi:hypothetical protein
MQFDLDAANVLKVDQRIVQLAAITIGGKLDRIEAILSLEAWVARLLTALEAPEECLKGFVQPAQGGLATRKVGGSQIGVGGALILQMRRLVAIRDRFLPFLPGGLAFGKRPVVEMSMRIEHFGQRQFLLIGGIQAILEGFAHSGSFLLAGVVLLGSSLFSHAGEKTERRVVASPSARADGPRHPTLWMT